MLSFALRCLLFGASVLAVDPAAIYDGGFNSTNSNIRLRIGNGGAGQSGLVGALANAFIQDSVKNGSDPFQIAWVTSDNTFSILYLASGDVDVGITYNPASEQIAVNQGIALSPTYYIFRDHFLLVGPPANPANLVNTSDVVTMFSEMVAAGNANATDLPTRFLSRFDKSATNIKESILFLSVGQAPWASPYSTWYHEYVAFPLQALTTAIQLEEYTLTDRGTYLSLPTNLTSQTTIYKASSDDADDPLLNPAHLLIGTKAIYPDTAQAFADWCVSARGQSVITSFQKNGQQLYSGAPGS